MSGKACGRKMKKITKKDIARLLLCMLTWVAVFFVGEYFFFSKGSWTYDLWDSILIPAISGAIVWTLVEWKPWKKKDGETECDNG